MLESRINGDGKKESVVCTYERRNDRLRRDRRERKLDQPTHGSARRRFSCNVSTWSCVQHTVSGMSKEGPQTVASKSCSSEVVYDSQQQRETRMSNCVGGKEAKGKGTRRRTSPASPSSGQGSSGSKTDFLPHEPRMAQMPGPWRGLDEWVDIADKGEKGVG
jgi:hypothetical protein